MTDHPVPAASRGNARETICNPFSKDSRITLPRGAVVQSLNPSKRRYVLARAQVVEVSHAFDGYVNCEIRSQYGLGEVVLPTVSWAGSGGYWCDAQVTPQLCAAMGIDPPELPGQDGQIRGIALDVIPSYSAGYTNEWRSA